MEFMRPSYIHGIGIRKIKDIGLPLLASVNITINLVNPILSLSDSDKINVCHYDEGPEAWNLDHNTFPKLPYSEKKLGYN